LWLNNLSSPSPEVPSLSLASSSMNENQKTGFTLIDASDGEPFPASLIYTPPDEVCDWALLHFLDNECNQLSDCFKIKTLSDPDPDRESHFSIGTGKNGDIGFDRLIDSGSNSDVFQVLTTITCLIIDVP